MSDTHQGEPPPPTTGRALPFSVENHHLASIAQTQPVANVGPHHELAAGVWLSVEADKGAELSIRPSEAGFILDMPTSGKARWVSLSFGLPIGTLRAGRYVCFLVRVASEGFLSYRPYLRYLQDGRFTDQAARDFMVSSGGEKEQLCHLPIDQELLATSHSTEAHLFFHGTNFRADFRSIEVLLIA